MIVKRIKISDYVIHRLPKYMRQLDLLSKSGVTRVSSATLGERMGQTASQIRQDFSCFGEFGQQGYGYNVPKLRDEIASIMGMDRGHTAILLGMGNIGRALAENFCFANCGIDLKCAFDLDPEKSGKTVNGIEVKDKQELDEYLAQNPVDIAVLCVPKTEAVPLTELLIACGVEAFWNFTGVDIALGHGDILVENISFSDSLMALGYYLKNPRMHTA